MHVLCKIGSFIVTIAKHDPTFHWQINRNQNLFVICNLAKRLASLLATHHQPHVANPILPLASSGWSTRRRLSHSVLVVIPGKASPLPSLIGQLDARQRALAASGAAGGGGG
jgi:hypothetical protein